MKVKFVLCNMFCTFESTSSKLSDVCAVPCSPTIPCSYGNEQSIVYTACCFGTIFGRKLCNQHKKINNFYIPLLF